MTEFCAATCFSVDIKEEYYRFRPKASLREIGDLSIAPLRIISYRMNPIELKVFLLGTSFISRETAGDTLWFQDLRDTGPIYSKLSYQYIYKNMRVPLKLMHFKSSTLTLNYICMHVCIHDVCIGK